MDKINFRSGLIMFDVNWLLQKFYRESQKVFPHSRNCGCGRDLSLIFSFFDTVAYGVLRLRGRE